MALFTAFSAPLHAAESVARNGRIELTAREHQWLAEHPIIRAAPDPDYQPIESLDDNGRLVGISADYLKLLENKLGIRFEIVSVSSWDEAMSKARSREVDMLSAATKTSTRSEYMSFTTPHIELPGVIIVRSTAGNFSGLDQLRGKKVGVVSNYVWQEWITRDYPGIDMQPVRDMQTGLLLVSFGQLDAMVGNLATATYYLKKLGITNLRVAANTGYFARLAIATRSDWPELNVILQKAVSSISPDENQAILDEWIKLEAPTLLDTRTILLGILGIIAVVGAAVAGSLIWNYSLRQMVRRQSASLRESEERLRAVIEDQTEFIARSLPHVHTLTFVNQAYCSYFGKSREELIGTSFMDHIPEEGREEVDRLLATLSVDNPVVEVDHIAISADGEVRWHRWFDRAIFDAQGSIVEIQAVGRDITDRRLAANVLRASEERFRTLAKNAPVGIFETGADGNCIHVNEQWCDMAGITEHDALGDGWTVAIHPDDREMVFEEWRATASKHMPFSLEFRFQRPDGQVSWVLGRAAAKIDAEGQVAGYVGTTTDLTEGKQIEAQLRQAQKMEAVGQLTGGIAHDFNNLLTVIQGNAELLAGGSEGDDTKARAILRASKRGAELTHRLLAFSRQQPLNPREIDLTELLQTMPDLLARTLGETVDIEMKIAADIWPTLADPGQLENALLNLAINARDAMPGGGKLTIECSNARFDGGYMDQDQEAVVGDYVALAVSDTGMGMSAKVLARAFEPFFTTKEVGTGTGLGLSMIYGFAKQSGGLVDIHSEEGKGTTVKIYLPRAEGDNQQEISATKDAIPLGRGESIMVIEDDEDVRALVSRMLVGLGYRVVTVASAKEARNALADEEQVDLLLSDVVLPGGASGPEFAEEATKNYPDIKLIFMSGYPAEAATRNGFLGSDKVLINKPFRRHQLAEALREALD